MEYTCPNCNTGIDRDYCNNLIKCGGCQEKIYFLFGVPMLVDRAYKKAKMQYEEMVDIINGTSMIMMNDKYDYASDSLMLEQYRHEYVTLLSITGRR